MTLALALMFAATAAPSTEAIRKILADRIDVQKQSAGIVGVKCMWKRGWRDSHS